MWGSPWLTDGGCLSASRLNNQLGSFEIEVAQVGLALGQAVESVAEVMHDSASGGNNWAPGGGLLVHPNQGETNPLDHPDGHGVLLLIPRSGLALRRFDDELTHDSPFYRLHRPSISVLDIGRLGQDFEFPADPYFCRQEGSSGHLNGSLPNTR